jgi:glycosyltransferase involved in cell wall biosynthesis
MLTNQTISVILPVYNVEPYLCMCLDSVIQQTYTDLEIILIDDGSTDRSGIICDSYARKDSRIVVLHQPNQGVSAARNKGLDICTGAYISFVDPDDYIDNDLLEILYSSLIKTQADMVGSYATVIVQVENYHPYVYQYHSQIYYHDSSELLRDIYVGKLPIEIWGKLYTCQVFSACRFETSVKRSADSIIWLDLIQNIHRCVFLHCRKYNYRIRTNGLRSINQFDKNFDDSVFATLKIREGTNRLSKELGYVGDSRYFDNIIHFLESRYQYGLTHVYLDKEKKFQQEIRQNILRLFANPFFSSKKKIKS